MCASKSTHPGLEDPKPETLRYAGLSRPRICGALEQGFLAEVGGAVVLPMVVGIELGAHRLCRVPVSRGISALRQRARARVGPCGAVLDRALQRGMADTATLPRCHAATLPRSSDPTLHAPGSCRRTHGRIRSARRFSSQPISTPRAYRRGAARAGQGFALAWFWRPRPTGGRAGQELFLQAQAPGVRVSGCTRDVNFPVFRCGRTFRLLLGPP